MNKPSVYVNNIGWNLAGSLLAKSMAPIFTIMAARILHPDEYGTFAIAIAILAVVQITKDFGISQAIVIRKDVENLVQLQFTVQLVWSAFLYAFIYMLAPLVARYYSIPSLTDVTRILALNLFFLAISDFLQTYHLKMQNYRLMFIRQTSSALIGGGVTVILAYFNFGVHALVFGSLAATVTVAALFVWKSQGLMFFYFDKQLFRELLGFGRHQMIQEFFGFLVNRADSLLVGRVFGAQFLGYYQMGNNLAFLAPNAMIPQVVQVAFTDMAKHKDDHHYLNHRYMQYIYASGVATLLFSILLYMMAPMIIPFVLGEKWGAAIKVVQIFSVVIPFMAFSVININVAKIYGFTHVYTYYALVRGSVAILTIWLASFYSFTAVLLVWAMNGMLAASINAILFFRAQSYIRPTNRFIWLYFWAWAWAVAILSVELQRVNI